MTGNAWRWFKTFSELRAEIRRRVDAQRNWQPFEDDLISDLILERHYVCAPKKLRPTRFRKTPADTPYRFYGDFPEHGWHAVSWHDAASKTSRKKEEALSSALRLEALETVLAHRLRHPWCERCGERAPEETHHEEPTWKRIVSEVVKRAGEQEVAEELALWDWFKDEPFRVRSEGGVKAIFDEIHGSARLEALCKPCHRKAGRSL